MTKTNNERSTVQSRSGKGRARVNDPSTAVVREKVLEVTPSVNIPMEELSFSYARSSGAGGQHVNKVNSKVLLSFDLEGSSSLTAGEKKRIRQKLSGRISKNGILHIVSMQHRSQSANRQEAVERFVLLLQKGLTSEKRRISTRIPRAERQKRLHIKKFRSVLKRGRQRNFNGSD